MKKLIMICLVLVYAVNAKEHVVSQKGKQFTVQELKVKVGDTILLKNEDPFAHNAYTDNEENEFDTGMQKPNEDKNIEIKAAGEIDVECAIHPNMMLKVIAE